MRKVPKLRFKEFSDEWEEKKLGEISDFLDGKRKPLKDSERKEKKGNYPYYGASGIIDYIDEYIFDRELILLSEDGANILTRSSRLAFLAKGKYWVNNHAHVIEGKKEVNQYFLCEYLEKIDYVQYNSGTAQPKLNQEVCKKILIKLPSLEEQEKIANFLSSVDKKISLTEEKLELFREYKKGVMQKIFSQKLRFKDSEGNDYPEWEEKKLGEIAIFSKGRLISKEDISLNGVECIRYGELYTTYKEKIVDIVNKTNIDTDKLILSEKNDVIIPSSGETAIDIAVASCVMKDGVALGSDLNIIKTKENGLYLAYFINNPAKLELASLAQGASVIHLYEKHLKLLNIQLPILEEQQKIADFLSSIDTKIENIEKELEGLKELKKGLLQQMFV